MNPKGKPAADGALALAGTGWTKPTAHVLRPIAALDGLILDA